MNSTDIVPTISLITVVVAALAYLITYSHLVAYVRDLYPDLWRNLGEPIVPLSPKVMPGERVRQYKARLAVLKFIFGNQSVAMNNRKLTILTWRVRVSAVVGLGGWANLLISVIRS
jgi:hypothetical protein